MRSTTDLSKLAILLVLALIMAGCSISMSSESSSESISTSSDIIFSPSTSSSGGDDDDDKDEEGEGNLYEEDIAALTVLYISHEKNNAEFLRQVGEIATKHGINNWEQEASSYKAMGKALKRAQVNEKDITAIPYFKSLAETDHYSDVMDGFEN